MAFSELNNPGHNSPGLVAVLTSGSEHPEAYFEAVRYGEGTPVAVKDDALPANTDALLAIGIDPFSGDVPAALLAALEQELPVLGVGWGMHALNVALGGRKPIDLPPESSGSRRQPVFISPGAKLSYTIAGSGWVTVPFGNSHGLKPADLAPDLLASCYGEDGFIAAFEVPGRNWVIGVQWNAHEIDSLPSGFDSLLLALVERATGVQ